MGRLSRVCGLGDETVMARAYAGVLGSLAWAVTFARGALLGGSVEATAQTAVVAMLLLAGVGLLVGLIAEATVDESVRQRLQQQLDELEAKET
jgi:hypothetical protein